MAEIGAEPAARHRAPHRMADAAFRDEVCLACRDGLRLWRRRPLQLAVPPGLELRRRLGNDGERHMGVLKSTVFAALAAIGAGPIRLDPRVVLLAGDQVGLAA